MDTTNKPTEEEIEEYFKYCARELGYPDDGDMVDIAITAAKAMFNGRFDTWKSMKKSDDFRNEYHEKHKRCPICGGEHYSSTLIAYVLDMNNKESYKDKNHIECLGCGYKGIVHDLVP